MRKTDKKYFYMLLYGIIIFLIFIVFYYNSNYFINMFFPSKSALPSYYGFLLSFGRIFLIVIAVLIFLFRERIYKKRKEFALLLITIIIFCLLVEFGSRIYLCNFSDDVTKARILFPGQCNLPAMYEAHHYLNYKGTPNYVSNDGLNMHNSLGFRGPEIEMPKPKNKYRIVTIGGSTTYTIQVKDWKKDFARQLERELKKKFDTENIEVVNAGMGGWNSWESLINLHLNVLDIDPDLLIIYHGTNDVHARLVNPYYYKSDNSGRRRIWEEKKIPLFFHSAFLRLATGINPRGGLSAFVDAPTTNRLRKETGFIKQLNGTPLQTLQRNKPVYFERNIDSMIGIAHGHNISVLLSTWAYSDRFKDYASTKHYKRGFVENNEVVKKLGKNVFLYDFASEMPMNKIFWADGRHVNEKGAELKGELFASYIYKNEVLKDEILEAVNG